MSKREWLPPANPPELEWIRLAAFIDGEGSIGIRKRTWQPPKRKSSCSPHYVTTVVLCNTDPRLIVWAKNTFQVGTTSIRDFKNPGERTHSHHRPCYIWEVSARAAQWILEGCFPFFVMKKDQAQICLDIRSTMHQVGRPRQGLPIDVLNLRAELKDKLHAEKKRIITLEEVNCALP